MHPSPCPSEQQQDQEQDREHANAAAAAAGLTALGQCKSTLEVQPLREKDATLRKAFRRALRVYDVEDAEEDAESREMDDDDDDQEEEENEDQDWAGGSRAAMAMALAMERVFADIPFSRAECAHSWTRHCAFVHGSNETGTGETETETETEKMEKGKGKGKGKCCYRPTATLKLFVWRKILEAADAEGMDVERQFLAWDLWRAVLSGNGGGWLFPRGLFDAVVRRVMDGDGDGNMEGNVKCECFFFPW